MDMDRHLHDNAWMEYIQMQQNAGQAKALLTEWLQDENIPTEVIIKISSELPLEQLSLIGEALSDHHSQWNYGYMVEDGWWDEPTPEIFWQEHNHSIAFDTLWQMREHFVQ